MYYEINVAKLDPKTLTYKHFFATAKRSLKNRKETKEMVKLFIEKFPEPEYNITISYSPEISENYSIQYFLELPD